MICRIEDGKENFMATANIVKCILICTDADGRRDSPVFYRTSTPSGLLPNEVSNEIAAGAFGGRFLVFKYVCA